MATAERFVKVWRSSQSLGEAARRLKMSKRVASVRASVLRAMGFSLKRYVERINHQPRRGRK